MGEVQGESSGLPGRTSMKYEITVKYRSRNVIQVTEKVDYPFLEFMGELGGILGLFVGMSILSVVELVVYLFIFVWVKRC